jgi:hypothetical protein
VTDRETLKDELRELFGRGATVAELLRFARESVGEDAPRKEWVGAVRAAFNLPPSGWTVVSGTESFGDGTVPDAMMTLAFCRDILEKRVEWDTPSDEPRWYDGLTKTPFADWQSVAEMNHGVSPEGWAALGEKDRQAVIGLEKMRLAWSEDLQILAALAEQLQRRVNELDGRHETPNHHPAAAGAA